MPSTLNIQNTLNWARAFINFTPLLIGGQEPALTIGNVILQTMLGPPMCWRWNRNSTTFDATPGLGQDYVVALSDFGFIEKAWLNAPNQPVMELTVRHALSSDSKVQRPGYIADQGDDNQGNITFRLMPGTPDQIYTVGVLYQRKAPMLSSIVQNWAPVPDEFGYIYNWGYLAIAAILANDNRFPIFNQKFLSHLLGAQQGLDEMQRNIFLGNWLEVTKAFQSSQIKTATGNAARQV